MFTLHQLSPIYLRARSICRTASLSVYRAPASRPRLLPLFWAVSAFLFGLLIVAGFFA